MIRFLSIIAIVLFYSCSNSQECNEVEKRIMDICVKTDSIYSVPLASLTDFEWDILYVISGPTVDNEAGDNIGRSDYKKIIPDNTQQYIFVKDDKVVKEYSSYCNCSLGELSTSISKNKYLNTSIIQVQKKESEGQFIYRVEETKD